jgi:hypothetical protein
MDALGSGGTKINKYKVLIKLIMKAVEHWYGEWIIEYWTKIRSFHRYGSLVYDRYSILY